MIIDVDILVLGSGIAGLSYGLRASEYGRVALITKKSDTESNTNYAQGGIAAVMDPLDSFESHISDTLEAGAGLCKQEVVEVLVKEGPERVQELMALGARFTRNEADPENRPLDLGREGGHSARRIVHAADLTGREIERALISRVKGNHDIRLFEHDHAIDLIVANTPDGKICQGVYVLDSETGDIMTIRSKVVMLATGGLGRVYQHTTNPQIATGDGVAMAYRAGASIANMEFIQFHPTTLFHPDARSYLISEAVRGEGGVLRLANGHTFMEDYHDMGCLAPRDVVARAIDNELKKSGDDFVYLDVTHIDSTEIKTKFPNIFENCLSLGVDMTKDWIPIVPAAHYSCGGVLVDMNGKTSISNLYACGEVACTGVHGANRLASNSLLEAVVFAQRASVDTGKVLGSCTFADVGEYDESSHTDHVDSESIEALIETLQAALWDYVGIVRSNKRLANALGLVTSIREEAEELWVSGRITPRLLELRNMSLVAELIVVSALSRQESRGLHFNIDFPDRDDANCLRDTVITPD